MPHLRVLISTYGFIVFLGTLMIHLLVHCQFHWRRAGSSTDRFRKVAEARLEFPFIGGNPHWLRGKLSEDWTPGLNKNRRFKLSPPALYTGFTGRILGQVNVICLRCAIEPCWHNCQRLSQNNALDCLILDQGFTCQSRGFCLFYFSWLESWNKALLVLSWKAFLAETVDCVLKSFLPSHELACNYDYVVYNGHFILSFNMEPGRWRRNHPKREEPVNTLRERDSLTLCLSKLSGMISINPSGCRMTPWNLPGAISHLFDRAPRMKRERRVSWQKLVRLEGRGQRLTIFMDL